MDGKYVRIAFMDKFQIALDDIDGHRAVTVKYTQPVMGGAVASWLVRWPPQDKAFWV